MGKRTIVNIVLLIITLAFIFNAGLWGYWLFICLFSIFTLNLGFSIIESFRKRLYNHECRGREYVVKLSARFMGLFFLAGTVCYAIIFSVIGKNNFVHFSNAELIFRSMMCSLDTFMLDVDSNVLDQLDDEPLLRAILVTEGILAFLCTIMLLCSLIFSRAKAYYNLHRKTKITKENNHLYIFFDMSQNSLMLAEDIHLKDKKGVIVFIDEANVRDDESDNWTSVVRLFTHRQRTFEIADETGALVAIASKQLCDINVEKQCGGEKDVFSVMGIEKVRDFIKALHKIGDDSEVHIFFLSEDEDDNIRSLMNLAKDYVILSTAECEVVKQKIYCHARYNGPNRVIEDLAVRKRLEVEIVDSSHLAVELLKSNPSCQPVRMAYMSEEYPVAVTKPLECLIVGFGEVGRDSFRFLYEFGTLLEMKNGKATAAIPHITAVDSKMNSIKGLFETNTPSIDYESHDLNLLELDYNSLEFYRNCLSEERCRSLNYIILALGDDDRNIALAINIFNRIRRYRADMSHLIIMVRCIRDDKWELMHKIADHYNKGCGDGEKDVIRLFGQPKEIYSYNTIICDDLTQKGKLFLENYIRLKREGSNWDVRHSRLSGRELSKPADLVYPDIDNLRKLRRQESQDLANALHASTKLWLMDRALGANYDLNDFRRRLFDDSGSSTLTGTGDHIHYPNLNEKENRVMLYLAMLEHFRWNAAHELLGYVPNRDESRCDERQQKHNCLRGWEELDGESERASGSGWECDYKSYDFCVVETTVMISNDENNK